MATSLSAGISNLKNTKKKLESLENEVTEELAKQLAEQVQKNYDRKGFTSFDTPATIGYEKQSDKCIVYAKSEGIAYEEFGTGDMGEKNPHQSKDKYKSKLGLLRYNLDHLAKDNNGCIKEDTEEGGYYWMYMGRKQKGIPSGNFMFNSWNWLQDNYKEIIKKKVDDVVSKH